MDADKQSFVMDFFFYWLAALPLLVALLVWFYFWRQKQLVKMMLRGSAPIHISCPSSRHNSTTSDCDKPPSYLLYQSFPTVHKTGEIVLCVEDLLPPPSYLDAVNRQQLKDSRTTPPCNCERQQQLPPPPPWDKLSMSSSV